MTLPATPHSGVPVRLTAERWVYIVEEHRKLANEEIRIVEEETARCER